LKKLFFLLTLTFTLNAHALTFNDLIERYGKRSVMNAIADKIDHEFTVVINGSMQLRHAPNPDYVTEGTLAHDSARAGLSPEKLELAILEKTKQDNEIKRRNAKNEEHLRQWEIEQAKEAEGEGKQKQEGLSMAQIIKEINKAYPSSNSNLAATTSFSSSNNLSTSSSQSESDECRKADAQYRRMMASYDSLPADKKTTLYQMIILGAAQDADEKCPK
jgi:hypothetical protein